MMIILFISLSTSYAQINVGGLPKNFSEKGIKQNVNFEKMSFVDVEKLKAEDEKEDLMKNKPWRFGQNLFVNFDIKESATHDVLKDGSQIWRFGVESKGALIVNFMFGMYKLPKGALLYVYNEDKTHVIGGFNDFNNQGDGIFATTLVTGDRIIIEYFEPSKPEFSG